MNQVFPTEFQCTIRTPQVCVGLALALVTFRNIPLVRSSDSGENSTVIWCNWLQLCLNIPQVSVSPVSGEIHMELQQEFRQ